MVVKVSPQFPFSWNLRLININFFWVRYIPDFLNHYKSLEVNTSVDRYCDFSLIWILNLFETIGMCGEIIRSTIWQSPFLYSKLYNIYSIFNIYCIGIGDNCIVWLIQITIRLTKLGRWHLTVWYMFLNFSHITEILFWNTKQYVCISKNVASG